VKPVVTRMPLSSGPHVRSASIPPSASRWLPCTGLRSTRQFLCMHPLRRNDAELTRWPSSGAHGPIGGFIVSRGQRCVTVTASGRLRAGGNITCAARVGLAQRPDPPGLPRSGSSRTAEASPRWMVSHVYVSDGGVLTLGRMLVVVTAAGAGAEVDGEGGGRRRWGGVRCGGHRVLHAGGP
jgi:hypothetical protein